ncbi:MAG: hypothetical protein IJ094_12590 [Bacilli bacterium]|nr:hypothetical protein [Bacilli bacterium]
MRKGRILAQSDQKKSEDALIEGFNIVNHHKEKMNKEREERKEKNRKKIEINNLDNDTKKYKKISIVLIFSVIIILFLVFIHFAPIIGISLNRNVGINDDNKIDFVSTDADIFDNYCSDLLIYSNQKITTYNKNGSKNWEYQLSTQFTPTIYIKDKYMVVANNKNGIIYFFENKKEILNTKIDGEINEVFIDESGYFAVEYYTNGYKKMLGIYSRSGKNLYNVYISSDPIVDVKMLNNSKELVVIQTNTSSFKVGMTISTVDITKENELKQIAVLDNNFIYNLTINGRNIIMLLDDKIVKCNIDTKDIATIYSFDLNQLMFISMSNNYYSTIAKELNEGSENKYTLMFNRFDNTKISSVDISNTPKFIKNSKFFCYLVFQDKLQIINKWGIEIKSIDIEYPPKDAVIFNDGKSVALIYTNKVYVVNL